MTKNTKIKIAKAKGITIFAAKSKDGKISYWETLSNCAKNLNLQVSHISSCLKGRRNHHKGYTFYFIK